MENEKLENYEGQRLENYTINEGYYLPSRGKIYSKPVKPLVELTAMNGFDELRRKGNSVAPLKVLADLIEKCMIEKPAIHVYDMSLGDYQYLLQKLRVITYGSAYLMDVRCPNCGRHVEIETDLDEFEAEELDLDEFEEKSNITLPVSGDKIGLNFQTPHLIDAIDDKAKELKRKMKELKMDFTSFATLLLTINNVNGEQLPLGDLGEYIKKMHAKDLRFLEISIDKLNEVMGGIVTITKTCPECEEELDVTFRFGPDFFRPEIL